VSTVGEERAGFVDNVFPATVGGKGKNVVSDGNGESHEKPPTCAIKIFTAVTNSAA
jgi:hypothetical protein